MLVLCLGFAQATESQMAKAWKMSEKLQSQRLRHPATPCDALRPEAAPSCFSWSGPPRRARAATLGAQC